MLTAEAIRLRLDNQDLEQVTREIDRLRARLDVLLANQEGQATNS